MSRCEKCSLVYEGSFHLCPVNLMDKKAPPLPADVEYLTKQLEIADGNLADCERNLEESIADNDKANERIKALEALAKQMSDEAKEWERLANEWRADYDKLKNKYEPMVAVTSDLDAYKRGVGKV